MMRAESAVNASFMRRGSCTAVEPQLFIDAIHCKQQPTPCEAQSQGCGVNLHGQKVYALMLKAVMLGEKSGNWRFYNKNAIHENNI